MKNRIYGKISMEDFIRATFALERIPFSDIVKLSHYLDDNYEFGTTDILNAAGVLGISIIGGNGPTKYRLNSVGAILLEYGLEQGVKSPKNEGSCILNL